MTTKKKKAAAAAPAPARGRGRPDKEVSQSDIDMAARAVQAGVPQKTIAKMLGMSFDTYKKHIQPEIEPAIASVKQEVVGYLLDLIRQKEASSIHFYLKTRCGWRDRMPEDQVQEAIIGVLKPTLDLKGWEELAQKERAKKAKK